jgi:glutamate synthase (NADPH/NADH)
MTTLQGTASRIEGVGFEQLGADALAQHAVAYCGHAWPQESAEAQELPNPGDYHFR